MNNLRCAFLTMSDSDGWAIDADLAIPWLQRLGWCVDTIEWRRSDIDWAEFDAVYLGTTWDYPSDPARFLETLDQIDRCGAILINDLDLVRWNIDKSYLKELQNRGAPTVPTSWFANVAQLDLGTLFDHFSTDKLIVKPVVSTNATDTFLLDRGAVERSRPDIDSAFANRAFMVQTYIANIETEGEYSLFYIDGALSHAIRKLPARGDFRVQEEHGALLELVEPDAVLVKTASMVFGLVSPQPVYARCDFVRADGTRYLLMEMELIEPSMYLRMESGAAARLATAIDSRARSVLASRAALISP